MLNGHKCACSQSGRGWSWGSFQVPSNTSHDSMKSDVECKILVSFPEVLLELSQGFTLPDTKFTFPSWVTAGDCSFPTSYLLCLVGNTDLAGITLEVQPALGGHSHPR